MAYPKPKVGDTVVHSYLGQYTDETVTRVGRVYFYFSDEYGPDVRVRLRDWIVDDCRDGGRIWPSLDEAKAHETMMDLWWAFRYSLGQVPRDGVTAEDIRNAAKCLRVKLA